MRRGARDESIEGGDGGRGAVHERRAAVDDGVEAGRDGLAVDDQARAADLPEARVGGDVVELEVAGVLRVVGAAEVELRPALGEVEAELAAADRTLIDGSPEEGILNKYQDTVDASD